MIFNSITNKSSKYTYMYRNALLPPLPVINSKNSQTKSPHDYSWIQVFKVSVKNGDRFHLLLFN